MSGELMIGLQALRKVLGAKTHVMSLGWAREWVLGMLSLCCLQW